MKKATKTKKVTNIIARVPTGIKTFDPLIENGLKKGSSNLVVGGPGSGKTIFAIQFLYYGIINFNENGLYITFEEKKEKLYDDMKEFGWDLQKLEKENKFVFLEYTPEQVKKLLVEGGGIVENIIEKYKIKRLVIDSISSFGLLYQDELAKKEASLALFELINSWGCTALLTAQENNIDAKGISTSLDFEVDSIIILYHPRVDHTRSRYIEILKMRGTKHSGKIYSLVIDKNGITIKSKS
ncbi:hypothetical protein J4455_03695 [Candidatus Woesearchaeota archaeon]|nr:hypothetical protein [Candidatus Woesearchaeota archaeon]